MSPDDGSDRIADDVRATRDRFRAHGARIRAESPSYAAWSEAVRSAPDVLTTLQAVPPTRRQPELVYAVARRLGADPADPAAVLRVVREDRGRFLEALRSATMQTNDPRRLAPVVPLFGAVTGPIGLVDVGTSAGLCSVPDLVRLDYVVPSPGGEGDDAGDGGGSGGATTVRMADGGPLAIRAAATGSLPAPIGPIEIVRRIGLDPAPLDVRDPATTERLVESVPPEATDRVDLMRRAMEVVRTAPPELVAGVVPDDLDRVLALLPAACTPVVMTTGTLVYVPGAGRQAFVDRVRATGARWIAMERTGSLRDVATTLPSRAALARQGIDLDGPEAFATVSLDGVAVALADAHGTRIHWLRSLPVFS